MHCNKLMWLGLALTSLSFADVPTPNPQALGIAESVSNFCSPIDAGAADRLRQLIKQLVQGANDKQLAEVRNTEEYRKAYDSVVEFTGKIDQHNVKKFCAETPK